MDDSRGVGRIKRIGDLNCEPDSSDIQIQRTTGDRTSDSAVQNSMAIKRAILLADVVNRADVGVIQRGRGLGFALKTGKCLRIAGHLFGQKLEGDEAMQPRVFGLIHHTHTAAAEFLDNTVVRDGLADHAVAVS